MFITLVWNNWQSFFLHHIHIITLPVLCLCVSNFNPLFHYCVTCINIMTLNYTYMCIKSSHPEFEVVMNANRLHHAWLCFTVWRKKSSIKCLHLHIRCIRYPRRAIITLELQYDHVLKLLHYTILILRSLWMSTEFT